MFDIAAVGLGATGVSLIKQLQDAVYNFNLPKPKIAVFNPMQTFARGEAFGSADMIHKVNTPPDMLAISHSEPDAFSNWLEKQGNYERYPNRFLYADFLSYSYKSVAESDVLDICEFNVLCVGNWVKQWVFENFRISESGE